MSVPAEQMQQMSSAPSPDASMPPQGGPAPSPISAPAPKAGSEAVAHVAVNMAMRLLQNALPGFTIGGRQHKSVLDVMKKLAVDFGDSMPGSQQLVPAEIQQLMRTSQTGNPAEPAAPPQ